MGKYIEPFVNKVKQKVKETRAKDWIKYGTLALAIVTLLRSVITWSAVNISVSNNVSGRELPIYCVETSEKKIALTFDAAWGNIKLGLEDF